MGRIIGIDMSGIGFRAAILRDGRVERIPGSVSAPMSAAQLLATWKSQAERYLGGPVNGAVIAVSAMLNEVQRERIRAAAGEAGLQRCRLISAPAAAALHYAWERGLPEGRFLAVHAGATEIDVAVMELGEQVVEVMALDGTDRWGAAGSNGVTAAMEADMRKMVRDTLHEAGVGRSELAGLIPSGDGPCISAMMDTLRDAAGCYPVTGTEPEESAVFGAAILGGVLDGEVRGILLLDATAYTLGVETAGGVYTRLIERNTTIPTRKDKTFSTSSDGQTSMEVVVVQGESDKLEENTLIGRFVVSGFATGPKGKAQVEISLDVDGDGRISIYAQEPDGKEGRPLTVTKKSGYVIVPTPKQPKTAPKPKAVPEPPKEAPKPKAAPAHPKEAPKPAGDGRLEAVLKLLPVYDSLSRAVQYEKDETKRQGSEAILRQYRTILSDMGVTVIETVGMTFDPNLHDAQGHVTDPRYGPNVIVRELEAGFMMDGKVIRFAKVQVAN